MLRKWCVCVEKCEDIVYRTIIHFSKTRPASYLAATILRSANIIVQVTRHAVWTEQTRDCSTCQHFLLPLNEITGSWVFGYIRHRTVTLSAVPFCIKYHTHTLNTTSGWVLTLWASKTRQPGFIHLVTDAIR